jgi:signal recognition particle subunit SRP54
VLEAVSERLQKVLKNLRGEGHITEKHLDEAMGDIRRALLAADVALPVVKEFTHRLREKALGQEVLGSLRPGQVITKLVHEELTALLGGASKPLRLKGFPAPILLVGLQGTGKTTTAAKLAVYLRQKLGKHVLLVPADTQRPAAREQLEQLGQQAGIPVLPTHDLSLPEDIAKKALVEARRRGFEVVVVDTAGRLHVDEELMAQLERLAHILQPSELLLVADAMTGQDAVRQAQEFARRLALTGLILTKLDGDARGGAALSVASVAGVSVRFAGVGEKLEDLELFHPDRMASRILGMGDVLTLVEKATQVVSQEKAAELERKLRKEGFDLEDFLQQIRQLRQGGLLSQLAQLLPGGKLLQAPATVEDKQLKRMEAIICSMTPQERRRPDIIDGSRRRRIARGAGCSVEEVNRLLRQWAQTRKLMKSMQGKDPRRVLRGLGL